MDMLLGQIKLVEEALERLEEEDGGEDVSEVFNACGVVSWWGGFEGLWVPFVC